MYELEYLRKELYQRSSLYHEHYHKANMSVITLWGGTLMLFSALCKNGTDPVEDIFLSFAVISIFFISVVMLYLSSKKNSDNMDAIHKIVAYQTIFYEERPKSDIKKNEQCFWELSLFKLMRKKQDISDCKNNNIMYKQPFTLSLFAVTMEMFF